MKSVGYQNNEERDLVDLEWKERKKNAEALMKINPLIARYNLNIAKFKVSISILEENCARILLDGLYDIRYKKKMADI
jgi:hypothetical protein